MKRLILLWPICLLVACSQSAWPDDTGRFPEQGLQHGMIQLGEKLEDPYTVENMQKALTNVYGTKADRVDITATDLYVRFLPRDNAEYTALLESGLYLLDHPMDYSIVKEGDYYRTRRWETRPSPGNTPWCPGTSSSPKGSATRNWTTSISPSMRPPPGPMRA